MFLFKGHHSILIRTIKKEVPPLSGMYGKDLTILKEIKNVL